MEEILAAREQRAADQQKLLAKYGLPLVCFTMNIPGPVKTSSLIRRAFDFGYDLLFESLEFCGFPVSFQKAQESADGPTAFFVAEGEPKSIKELCMAIENVHPLGRLFDFDVITESGKIDRSELGEAPRKCLLCGEDAKICASQRKHPVEHVQAKIDETISMFFWKFDPEYISELANQAVLRELEITPKPGLVDSDNNGSHQDMEFEHFRKSIAALEPYWFKSIKLGQDNQDAEAHEVFFKLRELGKIAEEKMFEATDGINTHKGIIFSLGIICCAVGRLWKAEDEQWSTDDILKEAAKLCKEPLTIDFEDLEESQDAGTTGEELFLSYGLRGARGEAQDGFPAVDNIALPALKKARKNGMSDNDAYVFALLKLISKVTDTCMIARSDNQVASKAKKDAEMLLLDEPFDLEKVKNLDDKFISQNLSPGGCADLLTLAIFLDY